MNNVKHQRLDVNETTIHISKLYHLLRLGEDIEDEYGIMATTDGEKLYVRDKDIASSLGVVYGGTATNYRELINELLKLHLNFLFNTVMPYTMTTGRGGPEFLTIVLTDGQYLVLEGEEGKVTAPYPRGISATHTHPDVCLMSHKDLETSDKAFINGYMINSVASLQCVYILYRTGPYTIDDREELLNIAKITKNSRNLREIANAQLGLHGNLKGVIMQVR
ncbi:hypothetical protein HS7_09360 [Sulfolobales archaeon HS-7]|nr:hypothetical protein HS7_09360 [Sulfolobales archaeon HS-7]